MINLPKETLISLATTTIMSILIIIIFPYIYMYVYIHRSIYRYVHVLFNINVYHIWFPIQFKINLPNLRPSFTFEKDVSIYVKLILSFCFNSLKHNMFEISISDNLFTQSILLFTIKIGKFVSFGGNWFNIFKNSMVDSVICVYLYLYIYLLFIHFLERLVDADYCRNNVYKILKYI